MKRRIQADQGDVFYVPALVRLIVFGQICFPEELCARTCVLAA